MSSRARTLAFALTATLALCLTGIGVLIGRATVRASSASSDPIALTAGIPLGVADTPGGALAADDNYLAIEAQSDEQDPGLFWTLVATAFAPSARQATLAQAAQLRASDTTLMSAYAAGAHALAVVGARRLDSYNPTRATVTTWLGGFVWGPTLQPQQTWNLVQTTLVWQDGRWLLAQLHVEQTPAPVPSIVYVNGANNTASAFTALYGMTAPYYGASG
jgi:hypothetical protein